MNFRVGSLRVRIAVIYALLFAAAFGAVIMVASGGIEAYAARVISRDMAANADVFEEILELRAREMRAQADVLSGDFGFRKAVALGDNLTIESALDSLKARAGVPEAFVVEASGAIIGNARALSAKERRGLFQALSNGESAGIVTVSDNPASAVAAPIQLPDLAGWLVLPATIYSQYWF